MRQNTNSSFPFKVAVALAIVISSSAFGQTQKITGLITGRDGSNVLIKPEGASGNMTVTVALNDSTSVRVIKGKFGLRRSDMGFTALIPGLRVEVEAYGGEGQLIAKTIRFRASDLKTANMIQAGLTPTQQELADAREDIEANRKDIQASQQDIKAHEEAIAKTQADQEALEKRFSQLTEYDVKGTASVYFAVNSATVTDKGKQDLQALADQAKQIKTYLIQVAGYTDSSGNADYNQRLSDRRAAAVTAYLQQSCGVPLFRVLAPAAMGMADPVASNETKQGKAANRRVEVKVIVNRGTSSQ